MIKPLQPGFHPRENRPISRCRRGCMVFHFRMLIMSYGTESKSRNADFMFIARKGDTTTLGPKGRCPLSASDTQPAADRRPQPSGPRAPSTLAPQARPI